LFFIFPIKLPTPQKPKIISNQSTKVQNFCKLAGGRGIKVGKI